jgi:hypothetical protein
VEQGITLKWRISSREDVSENGDANGAWKTVQVVRNDEHQDGWG